MSSNWPLRVAACRHGTRPAEVTSDFARHLFTAARRKAQRHALAQRKAVLRPDDWLDEHLGFAGVGG